MTHTMTVAVRNTRKELAMTTLGQSTKFKKKDLKRIQAWLNFEGGVPSPSTALYPGPYWKN